MISDPAAPGFRTLEGTVHTIIQRLGLRNRSHIIAHAMRYGVI